MVERYVPQEIEPRWQARWEADGLYHARIDPDKPKHYALTMLPYPSGDLHIGHWYAITPSDVRARYSRMRGYNVLFPMGFDAFGLPAENAAIDRGVHPYTWTMSNIQRMRKQLKSMGAMFDWEREAISCLPGYYRWTQWFFLKFLEAGIAYKAFSPVDFCPHCNTTLAREQVWGEDRHCERCGTPVEKKDLDQWFFRITQYADELLEFAGIDWPERVQAMQTNWIGRSEGAEVVFPLSGHTSSGDAGITVFTTRPDTLWGATFMVLAPEHPLVRELAAPGQRAAVEAYAAQAARQSEIERLSTEKEKTGVWTGAYARNPVNGSPIPIWIADYVMMTYGTGAIMAVPAHDERDFQFALKYGLPIVQVIDDNGTMIHSGDFSGTPGDVAKQRVTEWLTAQGTGRYRVNYRLHDWLISRQRYWGAPIPVVYCDRCGTVPVPYEDLPVLLPQDAVIPPTGENALKFHAGFLHTTCPRCQGPATRETDTMDTFMCSSWYQYAYLSPYFREGEPADACSTPVDTGEAAYWLPVDVYTGGIEHANMHLIYTRFFTKVLRDLGILDLDEPMQMLRNQGIILGEDGEKMSKSRGNVVSPDELVARYGADTVRGYLMFGWRWDQGGPWDSKGIEGLARFLNRVWDCVLEPGYAGSAPPEESALRSLRRKVHQAIRRGTADLDSFNFNTFVANLMELNNALLKAKETPVYGTETWKEAIEALLLMLAPACPHIAEELWVRSGHPYSVHLQAWPSWDATVAAEELITLVVQVNGKVRDRIEVPAGVDEETARSLALATEGAQRHIAGKLVASVIVVPNRLVNIVVR